MANLKQIRKHIVSVNNTSKLTTAMKMVAVAKLRRAQQAVVSIRPYVSELIRVVEHLIEKSDEGAHPLLSAGQEDGVCVLFVLSGDRGLCGAYNHNIVKAARRFVKDNQDKRKIRLVCIGRKAYEYLHRLNVEVVLLPDAWGKPAYELSLELCSELCEQFLEGTVSEAYVLYTKFKSAIAQDVLLDAVLPLKSILDNSADKNDKSSDLENLCYIYEPSAHEMLDLLLPRAVSIHLQRSLLEAQASEQGSRMTAMDNASKNADTMISNLTLTYNRARQAAITTELIEVVAGAEAL